MCLNEGPELYSLMKLRKENYEKAILKSPKPRDLYISLIQHVCIPFIYIRFEEHLSFYKR